MREEIPSRRRVASLVEQYLFAWDESIVRPAHPLVAVIEGHLEAGTGITAKETRPSGRSRPPIRDMRSGHDRTHRILKHVAEVQPVYRAALEAYAREKTLSAAAESVSIEKRSFLDVLREAIAVFQSGWLLVR